MGCAGAFDSRARFGDRLASHRPLSNARIRATRGSLSSPFEGELASSLPRFHFCALATRAFELLGVALQVRWAIWLTRKSLIQPSSEIFQSYSEVR